MDKYTVDINRIRFFDISRFKLTIISSPLFASVRMTKLRTIQTLRQQI